MPLMPAPRRVCLKPPEPEEPAAGSSGACRCLRRGARCTCAEDASWLARKREPLPAAYVAPPLRRAVLAPAVECRCLRRQGRCSCVADAAWLARKRRRVETYVAPHRKERERELEERRRAIAEKAEAPEPKAVGPSLRTRARRMEPQLEQRSFGLNPLQVEGEVLVDGLTAECSEQLFRCQGVKALPAVRSGRYHYEVELLRDCSLVVGWSSAMVHASMWDLQAVGYSSEGQLLTGDVASSYGRPYGRRGDVLGALVEWTASGDLAVGFMLNGEELGEAHVLEADLAVPLQPQIMQLPRGLPLKVRLRGTLAYPKPGWRPLSEVSEADFCPFSLAVAEASQARQAQLISHEHLEAFRVPDSHVVELYDLPAAGGLRQRLCTALGLAVDQVVLRATEEGTALAALRRASHARSLIEGVAGVLARPLSLATQTSRQRLADWRGLRPVGSTAAARRLIHGSLQCAMPLAHLVEEKNARRRQ